MTMNPPAPEEKQNGGRNKEFTWRTFDSSNYARDLMESDPRDSLNSNSVHSLNSNSVHSIKQIFEASSFLSAPSSPTTAETSRRKLKATRQSGVNHRVQVFEHLNESPCSSWGNDDSNHSDDRPPTMATPRTHKQAIRLDLVGRIRRFDFLTPRGGNKEKVLLDPPEARALLKSDSKCHEFIVNIGTEKSHAVCKEVRAPRIDLSKCVPRVYNDPAKTKAQEELIKNAVNSYFVFEEFKTNNLAKTESTVNALVQAFEPIQIAAGETIMRQGQENEEDYFYIVEQGHVEFQVDDTITIGSASAGECFGEEALLYHSAPNVTAVAVTTFCEEDDDGRNLIGLPPAKLLRLDQKSFRGLLHKHTVQAEYEKCKLIEYVDFLQDLLEEDKALVARLTSIMSRHGFNTDQEIEVNSDDTFYIVQEGTLEITGKGMDIILGSGDYLGERALLGSSFSRNGKVSSQIMTGMFDGGSYYTIDRATMEKVLGPSRLRKLKDSLKLVCRCLQRV
jgi:CRP-like cAMP-binding protein